MTWTDRTQQESHPSLAWLLTEQLAQHGEAHRHASSEAEDAAGAGQDERQDKADVGPAPRLRRRRRRAALLVPDCIAIHM